MRDTAPVSGAIRDMRRHPHRRRRRQAAVAFVDGPSGIGVHAVLIIHVAMMPSVMSIVHVVMMAIMPIIIGAGRIHIVVMLMMTMATIGRIGVGGIVICIVVRKRLIG